MSMVFSILWRLEFIWCAECESNAIVFLTISGEKIIYTNAWGMSAGVGHDHLSDGPKAITPVDFIFAGTVCSGVSPKSKYFAQRVERFEKCNCDSAIKCFMLRDFVRWAPQRKKMKMSCIENGRNSEGPTTGKLPKTQDTCLKVAKDEMSALALDSLSSIMDSADHLSAQHRKRIHVTWSDKSYPKDEDVYHSVIEELTFPQVPLSAFVSDLSTASKDPSSCDHWWSAGNLSRSLHLGLRNSNESLNRMANAFLSHMNLTIVHHRFTHCLKRPRLRLQAAMS